MKSRLAAVRLDGTKVAGHPSLDIYFIFLFFISYFYVPHKKKILSVFFSPSPSLSLFLCTHSLGY